MDNTSRTANPTPVANLQSSPASTPIPIANSSDLINPVKQFYSDLSTKQYYDAWTLLSKNFQNYAQNYDNFAKGYNTTANITVKGIFVQDFSNNTVYVELDSTDNIKGQIQNNSYTGTWKLIYEDGYWKLNEAKIVALNPINPTQTGKVIDHYDVTTGKTISIYENELLPYTRKGTQLYLTQAEIDWFEKMDNIDAVAQVSISQANAEIDRVQKLNAKYAQDYNNINNNSNSGYTPTNYQPAPQQTYEPYTYTAPTTSPSKNTLPLYQPSIPSSISTPTDNGFNATLPGGIQAHLTPKSGSTYNIQFKGGGTGTGNCYNQGGGYYVCGN